MARLIRSRDLNRRVQFLRATEVRDSFGVVEQWAPLGTPILAAREDVSDAERWRASEVSASITTRFVVRWSSVSNAVTPKDRVTCEGREYDITGIREKEGRRQWLEITATARIDK